MLNHRVHVAHAPHRWYALEQEEHGVNQLRVLGGVCECCLEAAMQFYSEGNISYASGGVGGSSSIIVSADDNDSILARAGNNNNNYEDEMKDNANNNYNTVTRSLGIPMHPVSRIEVAEMTKITENAYRYLQIAFAEDLYLYCQANNINFAELRDALNTKWNVNILEPRDGIGGHCLPKDTHMFLGSSKSIKSKILTAAVEVDQDYKKYRQTRVSDSILSPSLSQQSAPLLSNFAEDRSITELQLKRNHTDRTSK